MRHLVLNPRFSGFLEAGKEYPSLDSNVLQKFFEFCSKFPFGRNHMWLGDSIGPGAPFIEDALRPGMDLGYHLQHKLPRQTLQAQAGAAASALRSGKATVDSLPDLSPVKVKGPDKGPQCTSRDDLRIMRTKTRMPRMTDEPPMEVANLVEDEVNEWMNMMQQQEPKDDVIDEESGTPVPSPFKYPCERQIPPWRDSREAMKTGGASPPSTKPPSEVDGAANDVGCSSREMSE